MLSVFSLIRSWLKQLYTMILDKLGVSVSPADPGLVDPGTDEPGIEPSFPGEVICYYGCPNSQKAQKLPLQKKLYH